MSAQLSPVVKVIAGDLTGIRLVRFHLAQQVAAKVLDQLGIDRADKDVGFMEHLDHSS